MRKRFLPIVFVLFSLILVLASPAQASAPVPPRNPFLAPPTPIPAFLPPAPSPTPQSDRSGVRIFLPLVSGMVVRRPTAAAAQPIAPTVAAPLLPVVPSPTAVINPEDPIAESFIYILQPGDTADDLALSFGRDTQTMACVRSLDGRSWPEIKAGDSIVVPAMTDLCHQVRASETAASIADWYGVELDSLLAAPENHLATAGDLHPGQFLLIPNGRSRYHSPTELGLPRPQKEGWRYGDENFIWPVDRSLVWMSQGFKHGQHMAIDLATKAGVRVHAVNTGTVVKAGWSDNGYGYHVVIDHGIDYVTLYAHLSEYFVQPGDIVRKGDVIGIVGSTGNSTGTHLHFEIRDYGYLIDPLLVLPKQGNQ